MKYHRLFIQCLLHYHLFLDPPTIRNVTTSSKKSWIGQTVTLKCLSDGVPTPTLSWYKPEGSEINRVTARENKVQVPLRGDQDFGHYKCIAANGLIPSDEKLIKINQISKCIAANGLTPSDEELLVALNALQKSIELQED